MQIENFYDDIYVGQQVESLEPRLKKVVALFAEYCPDINKLLDIGCVDGTFTALLQTVSNTKEAYGIDISEEAVAGANANGIKAVRMNVDQGHLPYEDGFFDAVFCGEIIEHLYDPDSLLDEISRVLRKDGLAMITTPNLAAWHNRIILLLGYQPHSTEVSLKYNVGKLRPKSEEYHLSGHIRVFTCRALKELIKLHGFKILKIAGTPAAAPFPFPFNIAEKISALVPSLSSSLLFVVRK